MARVENLLKNRNILKSVFGDNDDLIKENVSDIDKDFITRFRISVMNRLSDSELSVETLGADLGLSRVQMYRKIKALTTYSPVELIRITRLKKGYRLIETTDMSISEIAYNVGFSSPSYFTKCFKEYFDKNPNEIMKQK
jgi:AraC-like DNA-binding protein